MMLDETTKNLLKINNSLAKKLEKLKINSIWDLILHIPIKYENNTKIQKIKNVIVGERCIIKGIIIEKKIIHNINKSQLLIKITDDKINTINIRFIHFYNNQYKLFQIGQIFYFKGQIRKGYSGELELIHPTIKTKSFIISKDQLTGIYPLVSGISQDKMQNLINNALKIVNLNETLPTKLIENLKLSTFTQSINYLHNPKIPKSLEELQYNINFYKKRLKFDELLSQQLSMLLARKKRKTLKTKTIKSKGYLQTKLIKKLKFKLTSSQEKVLNEILNDLQQTSPMNRLLQGDVGSGKTIIAAISAINVVESGLQVAIITPTEILAEQHYQKFKEWMLDLNININYLLGKQKLSEKTQIKKDLLINKINILIGTHAVFQENVVFFDLGLAIIDEQHKFGVNQRLMLKNKGNNIHQLMMSATPIPRTLTMSYFADLDISIINELPPERKPIINKLINSKRINQLEKVITNIHKKKQQVYWICTLIEESETLQLKNVKQTALKLKKIFPNLYIDIIHGKLKYKEKITIMENFKNKKIDILVATTVIEVGIDVPNASLMIIENSERIGLSQLHQLRGRIGRGDNQSICIFMFDEPLNQIAKQRLKVIYENNDGFQIAKYDLKIRGPGELLGIKQSGTPLFKFVNLSEDLDLLNLSIKTAKNLIENNHLEYINQHLSRWSNHEIINYLNV